MPPEMDPLLLSKGETCQKSLHNALQQWSHHEEFDGNFGDESKSHSTQSLWQRFRNAIIYISDDPHTYISLHTRYRMEDKFQPYFRRYPMESTSLTVSILSSFKYSRMLT